jgi:hypothetical protein
VQRPDQNAPYRSTDPARFSVAHGGKDLHPFPVPLRLRPNHSGADISGPESKIVRTEELGAINGLMTRLDSSSAMPPAPQCRN